VASSLDDDAPRARLVVLRAKERRRETATTTGMDGVADVRASTGPITSPHDDDDDDDDAFGARAGIRDGTVSLLTDDVLEPRDVDERDDETRATAIDADASLAEMFLHYSTRDAASDASDVSRQASSRARRDRVVAFDATRYCSSCKQHLSGERFPGAHRKTCTTCLRLHKAYQRRRRKRTKLCDEHESRGKP